MLRTFAHSKSASAEEPSPVALLAVVPLAIAVTLTTLHPHATTKPVLSATHAQDQTRQEIALRFRHGVLFLQQRQTRQAIEEFRRVLRLAPDMPEAHVNLGFALLENKDYAAAAASFDAATTLRPQQVNAYFGMAEAQEGVGNLRAAVEAMRAYLHLAAADDPFRTKAESAIWEWQEKLGTNDAPAAGSAALPPVKLR